MAPPLRRGATGWLVEAEVVVGFPLADAGVVLLPFAALDLDVVGGVGVAEGGADHVVLLQGVYGLAEVGGQEADAAGA